MPATALQHFEEDIARARSIVAHADPLPRTNDAERLLRSDLLRSAWMFAVGALDAYYCDAYTDIVAATANSKSRPPEIALPEWVYEIKFPIRAILQQYDNPNWRWRMAAREMMKRENVISFSDDSDPIQQILPKRPQALPRSPRRLDLSAGCKDSALWRFAGRLPGDGRCCQASGVRRCERAADGDDSGRSSNGGTTVFITAIDLECRPNRSIWAAPF